MMAKPPWAEPPKGYVLIFNSRWFMIHVIPVTLTSSHPKETPV